MDVNFTYEEMTGRNYGFISNEQQLLIKKAKIFIPGLGGMGGVVLENLVRLGVENFIIADFDNFEISNLNRQVFCTLDTVGHNKLDSAIVRIKKINPHINIKSFGAEWVNHLEEILNHVDFSINCCDDVKSTIALMRKSKELNKTVIDAFASPLPSVYVVHPSDPRPEEFLKFSTAHKKIEELSSDEIKKCTLQEIVYVIVHSTSFKYIVMSAVKELIAGTRKRFSLCPMVWCTGTLMSYEALKIIFGQKSEVTYQGCFFNPWTFQVEKPPGFIKSLYRKINLYFKIKPLLK